MAGDRGKGEHIRVGEQELERNTKLRYDIWDVSTIDNSFEI